MHLAGFSWSADMRTEALKRLFDAFTAIESIERFIANCTLDQYLDNELIQSAVERKFEINRIIHGYEAVDQLILWDAIQNDLPSLRNSLLEVLNNDPPTT
jgi:uncharacterized protein with HEPN domain